MFPCFFYSGNYFSFETAVGITLNNGADIVLGKVFILLLCSLYFEINIGLPAATSELPNGQFTPKIFYIGWPSDRMGSYTILYSIRTHQMKKRWRLDLDRIESAMLIKKIHNTT